MTDYTAELARALRDEYRAKQTPEERAQEIADAEADRTEQINAMRKKAHVYLSTALGQLSLARGQIAELASDHVYDEELLAGNDAEWHTEIAARHARAALRAIPKVDG